jgi:hypothetical protein
MSDAGTIHVIHLEIGECFRRFGKPYMLIERAGERYYCQTPQGEKVILLPDRAEAPGQPLPPMSGARVTLMAQAEFLELERFESLLKTCEEVSKASEQKLMREHPPTVRVKK